MDNIITNSHFQFIFNGLIAIQFSKERNSMKKLFTCIFFCCLSVLLSAQVEVSLKLNFVRRGIPPLKNYITDINIKNISNNPKWVLFPAYVEDSIIKSGKFEAQTPWDNGNMIGRGYHGKIPNGNSGIVTVLLFIGKSNESFYAFLLAGKSFLCIKNYPFQSWYDPDSTDMAVATALVINDSISMEKFLPYRVISDPDLTADAIVSDWNGPYEWKKNASGEPLKLSKKEVRFVHALGMKKYRLAITK